MTGAFVQRTIETEDLVGYAQDKALCSRDFIWLDRSDFDQETRFYLFTKLKTYISYKLGNFSDLMHVQKPKPSFVQDHPMKGELMEYTNS